MRTTLHRVGGLRSPLGRRWPWLWHLSIFEKVIVANSAIILLETVAGWWITQHNPETYHYLIDTSFIALAALVGMTINFLVLRAAFAPLHSLLTTMRAVEAGNLEARAEAEERDADVLALARLFNAMLDRLASARHEAAGRVLQAQEEERRRLALELHDQIGQSLTALTFHAEAIIQRQTLACGPGAAQVQRQAERLTDLAQRTLVEVQALSRQLRPPLLDDLGLSAALRWLAEDIAGRCGIRVEVQVEGARNSTWRQEPAPGGEKAVPEAAGPHATLGGHGEDATRLPEEVETALFRIAQESLTNAIRHGQAHQIQLALWQQEESVTLLVTDDGTGFHPQAEGGRRGGSGLGLEGMRERAQLLGGTLQVHSRPGQGCVVRVQVPLRPAPVALGGPAPPSGTLRQRGASSFQA